MERKINWECGYLDEIELVYEKAEENNGIGALLSELELLALKESEESCGLLSRNGQPITREMIQKMSDHDREAIMYHLSGAGLVSFNASMSEPKITVRFGPYIQEVLGCTMFSLLNRLEKLDGAYNEVRFPKATLEMQFPYGGRKGMVKWGILIMQLYPWLSIQEVTYNTLVSGLTGKSAAQMAVKSVQAAPEVPKAAVKPVQTAADAPKVPVKEKKGFFSKLFGK